MGFGCNRIVIIIYEYQLLYFITFSEKKLSSDYVKSRLELQTCQHKLDKCNTEKNEAIRSKDSNSEDLALNMGNHHTHKANFMLPKPKTIIMKLEAFSFFF